MTLAITVTVKAMDTHRWIWRIRGFDMRWELEAVGSGTRLTLWTNIDRRYIAMGAAGWQVCFDVLDPGRQVNAERHP